MLRDTFLSDPSIDNDNNKVTKVKDIKAVSNKDSLLSRFLTANKGSSNATHRYWGDDPDTRSHPRSVPAKEERELTKVRNDLGGGSTLADAGKAYGDRWKGIADAEATRKGGSTLADAGTDYEDNWKGIIESGNKDTYGKPTIEGSGINTTPELVIPTGPSALETELVGTADGTSAAPRRTSKAPTLRSAIDMAEKHGLDYDMDNMRNLMDAATDAQYAGLDTDYKRMQRDFYNMSSRGADDLYKAVSTGDRNAAMSGATKGANLAEQLMSLQASADISSQGATELSQAHADLVQEKGAAKAENAMNALNMYNEMGIDLATMSARELEALAETYAADVGYEATIDSQRMASEASRYAALQNRIASENSAKAYADASKYASDSDTRLVNDPGYLSSILTPNN